MKHLYFLLLLVCSIAAQSQPPVKKDVPVKTGPIKTGPIKTIPVNQPSQKKPGNGSLVKMAELKPNSKYVQNAGVAAFIHGYTTHTQTVDGKKIKSKMVPVDGFQLTVSGRTKTPGVTQKIKENGSSSNNGQYCQTFNIKVSANSEDFDVPYGTQASHIYPGATYLYDEYYKNTVSPKSITWEKNPIYIQAASSSGSGKYELVENPTQISLNAAVGKLKSSMPSSATNESTSIKMISLYDEADFFLKVNGGGGGFGFKADASFGISNNTKKSYFLIDAIQTFYTLNAVPPENGPGSFFKDPALDKTKGALFMASVSYGRRVLGVLETEFKDEKMLASFKASYTAGFAGGYADLNMMNGMNSQSTKVKLYFVGGNAASIEVPNATEASVRNAINNYLRNTTAQNAVPVKFTFRNMAMSGMRYESATDNFTYQQCVPLAPEQRYKVEVNLMTIENSKNEEVKFGIKQLANVYAWNKLITLPGRETNPPLLCWMNMPEPMKTMLKAEEPRTFKNNTTVNRAISFEMSQGDMMAGAARIELITDYIAMYATRVFGQTNDTNPNKRETVYLKNVIASGGGTTRKDIQINFNGRVFTIRITITATPI